MKGFTIIELLIVVAISIMLSAIAINYTGTLRNTTALSVETSKIAGFIFRAKDLTIATYAGSSNICGYGTSVNAANNTYSLFAYKPSSAKYGSVPPCPSKASSTAGGISAAEMVPYSSSTWNVPLANNVQLQTGGGTDNLVTVLFYPPAPATLLSHNGSTFATSTFKVYLATTDGKASTTISINPQGQVSF